MPFKSDMGLADLIAQRDALDAFMKKAKADLADLNGRIKEVAAPLVARAYERDAKAEGTVRFTADNHTFKCEVGKTVKWDSAMLQGIASQMVPAAAALLFKIEYSVPEAQFKAINDDVLSRSLLQARTVKYGDPKITLDD
jgi:hypothetical protein